MSSETLSAPADPTGSASPTQRGRRELLAYVLIAYGVTWALLIAGYLGTRAGVWAEDGVLTAWLVQVAAAGPLIAAVTLLAVTRGRRGLAELGRALLRWRVSPLWYGFVLVAVPVLMLSALSLWYGGSMVSAIGARWTALVPRFPVFVIGVALVTGLAEEPGWRGFALPRANERYTPLAAALLVSVVWALWHLPNALFGSDGLSTHLAHVAATTVNGLVQAWVYNATGGSLLLAVLLHGSFNATAGVGIQLIREAGFEPSLLQYYVVSSGTFGLVVLAAATLTGGRLGLTARQQA
jgi:membrane protease YdiL (CAAX protease family)